MSSVRRLLIVLLSLGVLVIALIGVIGTAVTLNSTRTVDRLVTEVQPAVEANSATYVDVLQAQAALRAFAISGDRREVETYRERMAALGRSAVPLRALAGDDPVLQRLIREQDRAITTWSMTYAEPRIRRGGGPGTYQPQLYRTGVRSFQEIDRAQLRLDRELHRIFTDASAATNDRVNASVMLISASAIIGALMLAVLGWWVGGTLRRPLGGLVRTVDRLREGEHDARASEQGPREIARVAAALNDLAEESERARAVELQVQQQLREMDTAKSDFVSNVSHELRTPLTIISGYLELLEDDVRDDLSAEQTHMLGVAQRNVMRLRELIEDLLTLNRAEHSGTTLELLDVSALVSEVVSDMGFAASHRDIQLDLDRPRGSLVVLGDASQLHRALLNLVSNALKFSPPSSTVRVAIAATDTQVRIAVIDQGMGIPSSELTQLGSRFFRASNAIHGEIAGTGLGLRIVQTIVSNHHGALTMTSTEGQGTTALVTLPLADAERQP